jgi:hypothetical protein
LKRETDDIYDPSYTDMLRVAFTTEFRRGKLQDLVALLSGRNFETKQFEEEILADSFSRLRESVLRFMNETHFKCFIMIIRSAGFVDASMIGSQNALNFAYILYLTLHQQGMPRDEIDLWVRRWFVFSVITGRYSGSPESTIDYDVRQLHAQGVQPYAEALFRGELSDAFWASGLPQEMETSAASSPYFRLFQAAQIHAGDKGFLSRDITVRELIDVKSDVHHVFPREFLKRAGMSRGQYNQIANYVVAQSEINIAIGKKEPGKYFAELAEQCNGGKKRYGNIVSSDELQKNLEMNCIPREVASMGSEQYGDFLVLRRKLMAAKLRRYFYAL